MLVFLLIYDKEPSHDINVVFIPHPFTAELTPYCAVVYPNSLCYFAAASSIPYHLLYPKPVPIVQFAERRFCLPRFLLYRSFYAYLKTIFVLGMFIVAGLQGERNHKISSMNKTGRFLFPCKHFFLFY